MERCLRGTGSHTSAAVSPMGAAAQPPSPPYPHRGGLPCSDCHPRGQEQPGTGGRWRELLGGPVHAEESVRLQIHHPPRGAGPWDPRAPRLERLEMGKIHSAETETIKGAEETHKEV